MKTLFLCALSLGLFSVLNPTAAFGQEEAPKASPAKQGPDPGKLEIEVNSDGKTKSFTHPSKALSEVGRAVSRAKRAKEGEEPAFEAVINLNDQAFTFSDPEAALDALKAILAAMRELPKLRLGLGDLGEIPEVSAEDKPQPAANPKPMGNVPRAVAMAEVRRRIQRALQQQMIGTGRGGVSLRIPSRITIQQTINREIDRARQEGLLPSNANAANAAAGVAFGDPREAKKEAIVQTLAFAFAQADPNEAEAEAPDKAAPPEKKPAEPPKK